MLFNKTRQYNIQIFITNRVKKEEHYLIKQDKFSKLNRVKKDSDLIRQYNIQIFNKIIISSIEQNLKATETNK